MPRTKHPGRHGLNRAGIRREPVHSMFYAQARHIIPDPSLEAEHPYQRHTAICSSASLSCALLNKNAVFRRMNRIGMRADRPGQDQDKNGEQNDNHDDPYLISRGHSNHFLSCLTPARACHEASWQQRLIACAFLPPHGGHSCHTPRFGPLCGRPFLYWPALSPLPRSICRDRPDIAFCWR
jgi:hypothetical protein